MSPDIIYPETDRVSGCLRIAIVTETYPPEINGVAHTMRHLAEGLAERGHDIQLIRPRQHGEQRDPAAPTLGRIGLHLVPGLPIPGYRGLRFGLPVYWRLRRLWAAPRRISSTSRHRAHSDTPRSPPRTVAGSRR